MAGRMKEAVCGDRRTASLRSGDSAHRSFVSQPCAEAPHPRRPVRPTPPSSSGGRSDSAAGCTVYEKSVMRLVFGGTNDPGPAGPALRPRQIHPICGPAASRGSSIAAHTQNTDAAVELQSAGDPEPSGTQCRRLRPLAAGVPVVAERRRRRTTNRAGIPALVVRPTIPVTSGIER